MPAVSLSGALALIAGDSVTAEIPDTNCSMLGPCLPARAAGLWLTSREGQGRPFSEQSKVALGDPLTPQTHPRMTLNWGRRLSLRTTRCGSSGGTHAAPSLGLPTWAVGRTQSGAADTSGLWHQHARAIFLPATFSRPVSLEPSSHVCLLPPTQWGTPDTV